jgi:hypothetical protein
MCTVSIAFGHGGGRTTGALATVTAASAAISSLRRHRVRAAIRELAHYGGHRA